MKGLDAKGMMAPPPALGSGEVPGRYAPRHAPLEPMPPLSWVYRYANVWAVALVTALVVAGIAFDK